MPCPVPESTSPHADAAPEPRQLFDRVAQVSHRMLSGQVSRRALAAAQAAAQQGGETYPWQRVVDVVLDDPQDEGELLQRGLRAQRDWLAARSVSGLDRARSAVRRTSRTLTAMVLSRLIFFTLYTVAVVALLVLLKHRWPGLDIYRLLDWARDAFPALFAR